MIEFNISSIIGARLFPAIASMGFLGNAGQCHVLRPGTPWGIPAGDGGRREAHAILFAPAPGGEG